MRALALVALLGLCACGQDEDDGGMIVVVTPETPSVPEPVWARQALLHDITGGLHPHPEQLGWRVAQ